MDIKSKYKYEFNLLATLLNGINFSCWGVCYLENGKWQMGKGSQLEQGSDDMTWVFIGRGMFTSTGILIFKHTIKTRYTSFVFQ